MVQEVRVRGYGLGGKGEEVRVREYGSGIKD
jgi:hypothetical protein